MGKTVDSMLVMFLIVTLALSSIVVYETQNYQTTAVEQTLNYNNVSESVCDTSFILNNGPECEPRPVLMSLPLPTEALEVIPNQIEVKKCGGVCTEDNPYHKCVPNYKKNTTFQVCRFFFKINE